MSDRPTLRIGTLGAARITPNALIKPARAVSAVEVTAVAARDPARAATFASKHGIPRTHDSYEAMLADPNIDAVYNPLPNGLHGYWTIRALEAGKHVLCEKPFTANAAEASDVAKAAASSGLVVMEAFHYRYHPLATRMREIVSSGELGQIHRIETWVCFPLPLPRDIRYRADLAGGACMDAGCYAINQQRFLASAEPEVVDATARLARPGIDRYLSAELRFPNGVSGHFTASLLSTRLLKVAIRVIGEAGRMDVLNALAPQFFNRVVVRKGGRRTAERVRGETTYTYQLRAFAAAINDGAPFATTPDDAIANMRVIDDAYRAAGLEPRQPTTVR